MTRKKQPVKPVKDPVPEYMPLDKPKDEPEETIIPQEDPDLIPEEEEFETPPYEPPVEGEGP